MSKKLHPEFTDLSIPTGTSDLLALGFLAVLALCCIGVFVYLFINQRKYGRKGSPDQIRGRPTERGQHVDHSRL